MDVATAPGPSANTASEEERTPDSLALVPFEPAEDRPFGRLIALALSALLALLLSWRFLLFGPDLSGREFIKPVDRMSSSNDDDEVGKTLIEDDWRAVAQYSEPSSSVRRPLLTTSREERNDNFLPTISLNSVRLLLPCDQLPTMAENEDDSISDLSSEQGPLPPYLDTITEEDTDDLSLSSGRSPSPLYPIAFCHKHEPSNFCNQIQSMHDRLSNHDNTPYQSIDDSYDNLIPLAEEEASTPRSSNVSIAASSNVSIAASSQPENIDETITAVDSLTPAADSNNNRSEAASQLLLTTDVNSKPGKGAFAVNGHSSPIQEERFSRAYKDYFQPNQTKDMDIDLERVMKRFVRYGKVYKDAPISGMEEFAKPKSDSNSSRSSSVDFDFPLTTGNNKTDSGQTNGFLNPPAFEIEPKVEDKATTEPKINEARKLTPTALGPIIKDSGKVENDLLPQPTVPETELVPKENIKKPFQSQQKPKPDPAPRFSLNKSDSLNNCQCHPTMFSVAKRVESPVHQRPIVFHHEEKSPVKTQMAFQPSATRIKPPTGYSSLRKPKKAVVPPSYFGSSEHLQQLLNEPKSRENLFASSEHLHQLLEDSASEKRKSKEKLFDPAFDVRKSKEKLFASSEHLQQLIQEPQFADGLTKETIFADKEQTGLPPTRYLEKRTDGLVLSQENLDAWNKLPQNKSSTEQKLWRWRNSINLTDEDIKIGDLSAQSIPKSEPRERMYQPRKLPDEENDSFSRSSKRSSSRYKAKIEKARREFVQSTAKNGSASDLYKTADEFEKKFRVSMEHIRRPPPEYRGPLLEKFNSKEWKSKIDLTDLPPSHLYARMPPSPYDNEYDKIVSQAERLWAAYRKRLGTPNLYSKPRSYSTSYLETDVDTGDNTKVSGEVQVEETDMDYVHQTSQMSNSPYERAQSAAPPIRSEHESRRRAKELPQPRDLHHRAKSADYLMDRKAREEIEPPENQLQKVLGDAPARELSEHELRFRKSIEKLHVPDWYLNSEYCPGKKYDPYGNSNFPSYATTPVDYTPETPSRPLVSLADRPYTAQANYDHMRPITTPIQLLTQEPRSSYTQEPRSSYRNETPQKTTSAYSSPWTGGRIADAKPQPAPRQTPPKPQNAPKQDIPSGFFDKYKEEIEELRRSRTSLHQLSETPPTTRPQQVMMSNSGVPMAAVRPRPFGQKDQSSSSLSAQSTSPQPVYQQTKLRQNDFDAFGSHEGIITSTPRNSAQLQRKAAPQTAPPPVPQVPQYQAPQLRQVPQQQQQQPLEVQHQAPHYQAPPPPQAPRKVPQQQPLEIQHQAPHYQPPPPPQAPREVPQQQPLEIQRQAPQYQPPPPPKAPREVPQQQPQPQPALQRPTSLQTTKVTQQTVTRRQEVSQEMRRHEGWTVSTMPPEWNEAGNRDSRVIEVADTFVGPRRTVDSSGNVAQRFGGRITLEEVLDSLLALPSQRKLHGSTSNLLDESSSSLFDTSLPRIEPQTPTSAEGPSVYTQNYLLMDRCIKSPEMAENLLENEPLWVKCGYCGRAKELPEARRRYVACKYCYSYYCSRVCRRADWIRHKTQCSFARINTICKEVIMKVREDPEAQWQMSRVARQGYTTRGRGSVNFRFRTPFLAEQYLSGGWTELIQNPGNYLYYYTVPDLVDGRKEPSLIGLCRRYDPRVKFILSVSIVADIDLCPETPPPVHQPMSVRQSPMVFQPETPPSHQPMVYQPQTPPSHRPMVYQPETPPSSHQPMVYQPQTPPSYQPIAQQPVYQRPDSSQSSYDQNRTMTPTPSEQYQPQYFRRTSSLPDYKKQSVRAKAAARAEQPEARNVLRSVLRSLENIAPGSMEELNKLGQPEVYERPYSAGGYAYSSAATTPLSYHRSVPSTPSTPVVFQEAPINV